VAEPAPESVWTAAAGRCPCLASCICS
jgi:hypothetical protein